MRMVLGALTGVVNTKSHSIGTMKRNGLGIDHD
jgi:hypothetical protein